MRDMKYLYGGDETPFGIWFCDETNFKEQALKLNIFYG